MVTVLIIEDEIKTARELRKYIESTSEDFVVLDTLQSIRASVKWLRESAPPDLIFSDIQLADGLSFEIFRKVDIQSPIIFCTAFDQYAIEAFKTSSIDYLLKPVDEKKLRQSLEKYKKMKALFEPEAPNKIHNLLQQLDNDFKKTLLVYFQEKIIPIKVSEIAYFHYELGNVYLLTFDKKKYFVSQTLDEFESALHPDVFFRVNRQFIVNRNAIGTIENYFSRRLLLQVSLPVSEQIIVSKNQITSAFALDRKVLKCYLFVSKELLAISLFKFRIVISSVLNLPQQII